MARKRVSREQALINVREFLALWDKNYPPEQQIRRTWDGNIIHAFSGASGCAELRASDLRVLTEGEIEQ